jgi:uncharacterized protein (TIGR03435 family)
MFERYTERARRVLFFARFEASQLGSGSIETEHLLLGLIREGKGLTSRMFARAHVSHEHIRQEIERRTVFREKVSTSVEIPFSLETKRVLQFAAEEADRLLHDYIGTEHLLLGILREERSVAASILTEKGMRLHTIREDIVVLLRDRTTDDRPPGGSDLSFDSRRISKTPDFVPSFDVHFMYSHTEGRSSVGTPRESLLCGFTLKAAVAELWDTDESRVELPPALPTDQRYDIVLKLPRDEGRETIRTLLRKAIERQFGVEVRPESRSTDVYVLTAEDEGGPASGPEPESSGGGAAFVTFSTATVAGQYDHLSPFPMSGFSLSGMPAAIIARALEEIVGRPVVDEAGLTGDRDIQLRATIADQEAFIRALRDEAGLILTPARRDIQVLVVRQR